MTDQSGRWPDGHQCAVIVTVDYNDIHGVLTQTPAIAGRDKSLSVWRYGTTRGVERMLAVLREHQVRATWFVPGIVAEENHDTVTTIVAAGQEIACSGYRHEDFSTLSLAQQQASVEQGRAVLERLCGAPVRGFRVPAGSAAKGLPDKLREAGFAWCSSWCGDDLPYLHPAGKHPALLVEIPLHVELEDEPYFAFNLAPAIPASQARIAGYDEVLLNWKRDFSGFQRFGLCYVLRLHPEIIGTVGRSGLLDELLGWLKSQKGVWFATADEVANWWVTHGEALEPDHPAAIFGRHTDENM